MMLEAASGRIGPAHMGSTALTNCAGYVPQCLCSMAHPAFYMQATSLVVEAALGKRIVGLVVLARR
eukprot:1864790-Amphidinium_carterae.1